MSLYRQGFDFGREVLKWIAIITMTVDHVGAVLYPEFEVLRLIGRLAFPLFAYLLILGLENTRNVSKYFTRLFVFALISQVPFFLAIGIEPFERLNIFFTLSFGLLFVYFFKKNSLLAFIPLFLSFILSFDYSIYGIAMICCMYILTGNTKLGAVLLVLLNALFLVPWNSQFLSLFALPLIILHRNGSLATARDTGEEFKIPLWRKYFFYVYYPLHLALLDIIILYYF
ncbi:conjugal transfer protein TraX [Candidatus Bathyarchaeota archaeon]|nr:conjugal transfer protein TraX [Candidatus Bathyarchaeota archaeon]